MDTDAELESPQYSLANRVNVYKVLCIVSTIFIIVGTFMILLGFSVGSKPMVIVWGIITGISACYFIVYSVCYDVRLNCWLSNRA